MAVLCERSIQNILYIVIQISVISGKQCYFRETNQNLTKCDVSDWFACNCFCCGTDVLQQNWANRVRGICCPEVAGQNIEKCKTECNITVAVTESGLCADHCSHITSTSFFSFATTPSPLTAQPWAGETGTNNEKDERPITTANLCTFCYIGPWTVQQHINASSTYI